jgi:hypothetical protein
LLHGWHIRCGDRQRQAWHQQKQIKTGFHEKSWRNQGQEGKEDTND